MRYSVAIPMNNPRVRHGGDVTIPVSNPGSATGVTWR
jgi:hypothetical protein